MNEFKNILKELRQKENLSQEALGNIIHVSRSSIAKYENGLGLPSDEVVNEICVFFKVDRDYLFPKQNIEQLIIDKNIKINKQRKSHIIITSFLLLIIFFLIIFVVLLNTKNYKEVVLDDDLSYIDLKTNDYYEDNNNLIKYSGGYILQQVIVKKIDYTDRSNLYLINVKNDYTNGYMACCNDEKGFNKNEYTKKVYMRISFPQINTNIRPIISWHQKKDYVESFTSYMGDLLEFDTINLYNGAILKKDNNECSFIYESSIYKMLLDNEYQTLMRTCNIDINNYYSSWEYEMVNEVASKLSFSIVSSYLVEAVPNQTITLAIDTTMNNTNMSINQKRIVKVDI